MHLEELEKNNKLANDARAPGTLFETKSISSMPPYFGVVECPLGVDETCCLMFLGNNDDMVAAKYFFGGMYETTSIKVWASLAKQSKVIFDIGSHTGIYALAASAINGNAKVSSFEPVPMNVQRQILNISLNGFKNINLYDFAAARRTEMLDMHIPDLGVAYHTQGASFVPSFGQRSKPRKVQGISIDDNKELAKGMDLVKIDAEGGEFEVLMGMKNSLNLYGPTLLFECNVEEVCTPIEELLKELGYHIMVIFEDENRLDSVECLEVYRGEKGTLDRNRMNRLAIPNSKVERILEYLSKIE